MWDFCSQLRMVIYQIHLLVEMGRRRLNAIQNNDVTQKGAEVIYDTDDDNVPLRPKLPVENQMLEMYIDQRAKRSTTNIYKQVT